MVEIFYNNQNPFSNVGPTPFVSMSQDFIDYGKSWNQVTNLTLEGQLTGKYLGGHSFSSLNDSLSGIISKFSSNFGKLDIKENGGTIYSASGVVVKSINIDQSNWYGILPYTIELTAYEQNLFTNYFGITDPVDEVSYQDEDGKILSYTRKISAKGFNIGNKNAIVNAKEWVLARKNISPAIKLFLVKDNPSKDFLLESENEVIDRFNGTYSIELNYRKNIDDKSPKNAFLNYTIDLSINESDDLITANINGTLSKNTMEILSLEYNKLNLHFLCNSVCSEIFNENLSSRPISLNVSESPNTNTLSFSASYNNDYSDDIIEDTTVDCNFDALQCSTRISVNASISCKYGDKRARWEKVQNYYQNVFNAFGRANSVYNEEFGSSKKLLSTPLTESITYNELDANISYTAEYTDKKRPLGEQIASMTSSVSYTPSVNLYAANTSATKVRDHNIQDLSTAKRCALQLTVSVVGKPSSSISNVIGEAANEINRLKKNYMVGAKDSLLDTHSTEITENPNKVTRNENWSFEGTIIS